MIKAYPASIKCDPGDGHCIVRKGVLTALFKSTLDLYSVLGSDMWAICIMQGTTLPLDVVRANADHGRALNSPLHGVR